MAQYELHDFYCLQCGQRGIPLRRKSGFQHGKFHRKKLYCPHCKCEINHIEITNTIEKEEFEQNFQQGVYVDEATQSCNMCRSTRSW